MISLSGLFVEHGTILGSTAFGIGTESEGDWEFRADTSREVVGPWSDLVLLTSSRGVLSLRLELEDIRGWSLIDLGAKAGSVDLLYVARVKPGIEISAGIAL